MILDTILIQ